MSYRKDITPVGRNISIFVFGPKTGTGKGMYFSLLQPRFYGFVEGDNSVFCPNEVVRYALVGAISIPHCKCALGSRVSWRSSPGIRR